MLWSDLLDHCLKEGPITVSIYLGIKLTSISCVVKLWKKDKQLWHRVTWVQCWKYIFFFFNGIYVLWNCYFGWTSHQFDQTLINLHTIYYRLARVLCRLCLPCYNKVNSFSYWKNGRCVGGVMVSAPDSRQVVWVWVLARYALLCSYGRQFILTVPLSTQAYK